MTRLIRLFGAFVLTAAVSAVWHAPVLAASQASALGSRKMQATATPAGIVPPSDYVLGAGDLLSIFYWGDDKDLGGDVVVRPDGKISLSLLNDIEVGGLTPDEARERIAEKAKRFVDDPTVTVVVKEIRSRQVFITGEVEKPAMYPLTGPMTVSQLIIMAGGTKEFAKKDRIWISRTENGRETRYPFDYKDFLGKNKNPLRNIYLKPGDQVIVP